MIIEDTGCLPEVAPRIEVIMRDFIFHSTLDWQSRERFRSGAIEAAELYAAERGLFDQHFQSAKAAFEQINSGGRL